MEETVELGAMHNSNPEASRASAGCWRALLGGTYDGDK
jgi:hypothetical protein